MSTQRRENRWQHYCTEFAGGSGHFCLVVLAWFARAFATVGTAPPHPTAWLATNSPQSDHLFAQLVRFVEQDIRLGSPPIGKAARMAGSRSSLPLTPTPSVLEPLHPFRSNHPAGQCRWTERYDGKRDL